MTERQRITSSEAFALLDRTRFSETPLNDALARIADVTLRAVPGADEVSVTLLGPGGAHTAAFTGKLALQLDEWQYEHGHGPCLAAATATITVGLADIAADCRWPRWADRALEAGAHSSLSVGLPLRADVSSALNLYATAPEAFDEDAVILAQTLAGYTAMAIANSPRPDIDADGLLWASAADRTVVEQARGVLMAERHCSAETALHLLRQRAEASHRSLQDVAASLVADAARLNRI